jgi:hypothetical protein
VAVFTFGSRRSVRNSRSGDLCIRRNGRCSACSALLPSISDNASHLCSAKSQEKIKRTPVSQQTQLPIPQRLNIPSPVKDSQNSHGSGSRPVVDHVRSQRNTTNVAIKIRALTAYGGLRCNREKKFRKPLMMAFGGGLIIASYVFEYLN